MKTIFLFLTLCFTATSVSAQKVYSKTSIERGVWLRVDADQSPDFNIERRMKTAVDTINYENDMNPYANPWVGINLQLTWGQLRDSRRYNGKNYDAGIQNIKKVLDDAKNAGLFVQLNIADKYQSDLDCNCGNDECDDDYFLGSTPRIKDATFAALDHKDFNLLVEDTSNGTSPDEPINCANPENKEYYEAYHISKDTLRYARQQDVTRKEDTFRRKYFSVRWNNDVQEEWLRFWKLLGEEIGEHPALHSIITPESSNSINGKLKKEILMPNSTTEIKKDNLIQYPGGEEYVSYLADMSAKLRSYFPDEVLIINNTNWIFPNQKPNTDKENPNSYYQKDAADSYLLQNDVLERDDRGETIGWCAQDIVLEGSKVDGYYKRGVYTQIMRFPSRLRFGFVTGESKLTTTATSMEVPSKILKKTNDFGLSNLVFITGFSETLKYRELIRKAKPGDYPFMPKVISRLSEDTDFFIVNSITKAYLKLNFNGAGEPTRIDVATTDAGNAYNSAKWNVEYDNRFDPDGFQLFNKRSSEIIRYKAGGTNAGKIVRDDRGDNINFKGTFWKIIPTEKDGHFYLENFESGKILKHDDTANELRQTTFRNGKAEWVFIDSKLANKKRTASSVVNKELLIYPNPTSQIIQINRNDTGIIVIYDMNGKILKSYAKGENTIDVSDLKKGVYFLQANETVRKFIKQ